MFLVGFCILYLCICLLQVWVLHRHFSLRIKAAEFESYRAHIRIDNMKNQIPDLVNKELGFGDNHRKTVVFRGEE